MIDYSYSNEPDSAVAGLYQLVLYLNNAPNKGTGVAKVVQIGENLMGEIPQVLIDYVIGVQNNVFGGYPDSKDVAPSIVFTVVFAILMFIHLAIFIINCSRGHYFYISIAWIIYCIFRVIGFALRIVWAKDVTNIAVGLTSEFFSIVASMIIVSFNLMLTQRLFTWRHPVGGSRKLFWTFMLTLYGFVLVIVAITVLASFVPYLHFLSTISYEAWQKVVMASAILIILYSLTSVSLLGLSYWSPTKKDENLYTYQPWWIESFSTFYFVKKDAAKEAAETFMKRNTYHRHAVRVIAATKHHHNMVEGLSTQRGNLSHNLSMGLIIFSTCAILVGAILRAIIVFEANLNRDANPIGDPVVMYICWGLLEFLINASYIIWRVDLRFYRPDRLPKKVRAIITAQQSGTMSKTYASDAEDNESFVEVASQNDLHFNDERTSGSDRLDEHKKMQESYLSTSNSELNSGLPYPTEKVKGTDETSDFKF